MRAYRQQSVVIALCSCIAVFALPLTANMQLSCNRSNEPGKGSRGNMQSTTQAHAGNNKPTGRLILSSRNAIISLDVGSRSQVEVARCTKPIRYAIPVGQKRFIVVTDERDLGIQSLNIVESTGETEQQIHLFKKTGLPVIAPTDDRVAWVAERDSRDGACMYVTTLNDLKNPRIIEGPFVVDNAGPQWYGKEYLLIACKDGSIGRLSLTTGNVRPITRGSLPVYNRIADEIVFMRGHDLWVRPASGQAERKLVTFDDITSWYNAVQVSPDGRFVSCRTLVLPTASKLVPMHKVLGIVIVDLKVGSSDVLISADTNGPWAWLAPNEKQ
ncbi:MAG: DPP IV N-terminal domain-containing protein [Nitrospira sp.]|nr:DPP IV N-terminal domain-containing protein [Nitrospira sp.]